jgi:hypothetical protein
MKKVYFIFQMFMMAGCSALVTEPNESNGDSDAGLPINDLDSGSLDGSGTFGTDVETENELSSSASEDPVSTGTPTEDASTTDTPTSQETSDTPTEPTTPVDTDTFVDTDSYLDNNPCYKFGEFLCTRNMLFTCDSWGKWAMKEMCSECDNSGYCGCKRTGINCDYICVDGDYRKRTYPYCPNDEECHQVDENTLSCGPGPLQP